MSFPYGQRASRTVHLFLLGACAIITSAQTLVFTGGGTGAVSGGSVSWSVGEPVIGSGTVPGGLVTQGYQQPTTLKLRLHLAAALQGPYNSTTGLMSDALRSASLIPLAEPYTAIGYVHVGGGGEATTAPVLAITGGDAVVDWVLVELRSTATPATVVESRCALLQRDGDVVATDGISPVAFNAPAANYHVAVRHRNHLGAMTLTGVPLNSTPAVVDLTLATTTTYGTNARKPITGTFPAQALWAGDVNFNKQLKYAGGANDRDPILTAIGGIVPTNTLSGQYRKEDINMNGQVKYSGSANDRDILLQNIGGSVPTAVRNAQLP